MECFRKDPRFKLVETICNELARHGYQALLAGGCVRDGILNVSPNDYDVATSATPDQVEALFEKTVAVGKSFGVIVVVMDGHEIEVATFRKDGGYQDGRRPDCVEFSSAQEDAKRRDFTVNALFYDLKKNEVIDYVGGLEDLRQKKISAVGDPEKRFAEDHLRILRALRFVSQLGFTLDAITLKAVKKMSASVSSVSGERIHQEILKLLSGKARLESLRLVFETGVLAAILKNSTMTWKNPDKYFSTAERDPNKLWSLWWLWVQDLQNRSFEKAEIENKLQEFRLSRNQSAFVKKVLDTVKVDFSSVKLGQLLVLIQEPAVQFAFEISQESQSLVTDETWKKISQKLQQWQGKFPENLITAADLPKNIQGPQIGEALKKAYAAQLEDLVNDKKSALEYILNK